MKTAYFDCFSGISGDMTLGALVDAGCPFEVLRSKLQGLSVPGWEIAADKVWKNGMAATHVRVRTEPTKTHRSLATIREILDQSDLASEVKHRADAIFTRLGEAEAVVHDVPLEKVHFHEVGAVDAVIDIVGACIGFSELGIESFSCSPLNVGGGTAKTAHGILPVPAPATARLLMGKPTYSNGVPKELVTPTGAAIVATVCESFGPLPAMKVSAIGYGAANADLEIQPNVLRIMLGEVAGPSIEAHDGAIRVLEANIDDMNPQIFGYLLEKALAAGALDVFATAIYMKKNRPGMLVSILCKPQDESKFKAMLFTETTTLGLRSHLVDRYALPREHVTVTTRFGKIRVKVSRSEGRIQHASPEFDDCRKLAEEKHVPLQEVMEQALLCFEEQYKK
jgi:uncharacterized protein (TIGR00299 family) protein